MKTLGNLRPILSDEIELMRSWRNHPTVRSNMYTRHEISAEEHRRWWEETSHRRDRLYLMYESIDGKPEGIVGFNSIEFHDEHAFWAFYASPDAPQGTGTRMEFLALDYAFDVLHLHKLSCEVLAFNERVIKLHEKFGFAVEGLFRAHHKREAEFCDIYRLAIFSADWKTRHRSTLIEKLIRRRNSGEGMS